MSDTPPQQVERVYVEPQIAKDLEKLRKRFLDNNETLTHNIIEAARVAIVDLTIRCEDRGASFKEVKAELAGANAIIADLKHARAEAERSAVGAHAALVTEREMHARTINDLNEAERKLAIAVEALKALPPAPPPAATEGRPSDAEVEGAYESLTPYSRELVRRLLAHTKRLEEESRAGYQLLVNARVEAAEKRIAELEAQLANNHWRNEAMRIATERDQIRAQLAEQQERVQSLSNWLHDVARAIGCPTHRELMVQYAKEHWVSHNAHRLCSLAATEGLKYYTATFADRARTCFTFKTLEEARGYLKIYPNCVLEEVTEIRRTLDTTDAKAPDNGR